MSFLHLSVILRHSANRNKLSCSCTANETLQGALKGCIETFRMSLTYLGLLLGLSIIEGATNQTLGGVHRVGGIRHRLRGYKQHCKLPRPWIPEIDCKRS